MARIVVIFSLCLAACDVGQLPGVTGDGGGSADAAGNGCEPIAATIPVGHHPPDHESRTTGCMSAAGCHNAALGLGALAPEYSYGGLLFKADKTTPYGGATIVVKLGAAEKRTTVSDNGEFFMVPGVAGLDPPTNEMTGQTSASGCPNLVPMVAPILAGGGDCSKSGCHAPIGSAVPGNGPIYLP